MTNHIIKQMLYLTIRRKGEIGHIVFEMEPYYRRTTRHIHTEKEIDVFDRQILLRDDDLKEAIGFSMILSLFIYGTNEPDPENRVWSQIAYPHFRGKQAVIRFDMEPYRYKPTCIFCSDLLLPSLDVDVVSEDESFKRVLAERILSYMPISEELCFLNSEAYDYLRV